MRLRHDNWTVFSGDEENCPSEMSQRAAWREDVKWRVLDAIRRLYDGDNERVRIADEPTRCQLARDKARSLKVNKAVADTSADSADLISVIRK